MQYNRLNNPNALIDLIKALDKRVSGVETRGTGPIGFVGADGVELHIGVQPDGQAAIVPFVGDVTPPPIATSPDASAGPGFLTVTWDGLFVNGEAKPLDFEHLNVVGNRIVNGVSNLTVEVGIIRNPMDSCLVGTEVAAVGETWEFVFVSEDYNGNLSAISAPSNQVVQKSFAADVLIDEALGGLQQDFINAQSAAVSAQQAADDAQDAADEAKLVLGTKGTIFTQSTAPSGDLNSLWIDTAHNNIPRRYVGVRKALFVNAGGGSSVGGRLTSLGWNVTTVSSLPTLETASAYDLVAFDAGYSGLSNGHRDLAVKLWDRGVNIFTSGNDTTNMEPLFSGVVSRGVTAVRKPIRATGTTSAGIGWAEYSDVDLNFYLTGVNASAFVTGVTLVDSLGEDRPVNIVMENATTFARWTHVQTYATPVATLNAHLAWISDNWVTIQDQGIVSAASAAAAAQLKADQAFNNAATAATAAGTAQTTADKKNTFWYQDDQPAGTGHKVGDSWVDTNDGYKLRTWNGSIWQTVQDSALAQQTAESKGRTYTQAVAPPVEARLPQNTWIDISLGLDQAVTKYWDATAGAWLSTSEKAAKDAQATADAKGETIYSDSAPAAAKQLPQNTWIDTTGGLNIQKRWVTGSGWVTVVDSRIPSTAAAVTAVDSRVTSVSAVAESKGITYTQNTVPPVSARLPQNVWIDTSLGLDKAVTKYWDGSAWTAVSEKAASDAKAVADSKGETIYSSTEPAAAKRLAQNTWVDTTGGLNITKRWDGFAWVVTVDSRIPSTAVAVTAVDARVDSVSATVNVVAQDVQTAQGTANSKGVTLTQSFVPAVEFRQSQNIWNDTSLGLNNIVQKYWNGSAWTALTDKAATDAATAASGAQTAAETAAKATSYSANPSFDDWTGTGPASYSIWTSNPVKDTTNKRIGAFGLQFVAATNTDNRGISFGPAISHAPNLEYFTVEVEFMLTSGTSLQGAGILLDWNGLTPSRSSWKFADSVSGTPVLNKWYRLAKTIRRQTNSTGTWTSMGGYLMANYNEVGTPTAKTMTFDWLNVRPATAEEILAYNAPADAQTKATTAKTEAIAAASTDATTKSATAKSEAIAAAATDATNKASTAKTEAITAAAADAQAKVDKVWASARSYINRGTSVDGIQVVASPAPVVIDSATAMGGKALQKAGTGSAWWIDKNAHQAFDPTALYKVTARIRVTTPNNIANAGRFYLGMNGYLADGVTHCNATGANSSSSQHYMLNTTSFAQDGSWVDFVGYVKGNSAGNSGGSGTSANPTTMHANVRYIAPLVIMDFSAGNSVMELSHLSIDIVGPEGYQAIIDAEKAKNDAIAAAALDATQKANQAKSDAIAAASSDATSKANAAQAAAITAAAADATAKAEQAEADAAATAAADATTKANAAKQEAIDAAQIAADTAASGAEQSAIDAAAADATAKANAAEAAAIAAAALDATAKAEQAEADAAATAALDATAKANAAKQAAIDAAAADATLKANAAINASAYSLNPSFDDWTGTYPVGFGNWSSAPVKETSIVKRAPNAVRFNVPDASAQYGLTFTSILAHAPNLEFFTVEVDIYLVSGTLAGTGMILDWNGMTNNRAQIQFASELPGAVTGKWYRVSKVLRRPTNATGTWSSMGGYLMGQWSGHGAGSAKNVIYDWFNVRPSTTEEILSYKAPTTADVSTAKTEAINAASADATSKANAAQSAAIAAAALDATAKADQAEADAAAAAATDATTKANTAKQEAIDAAAITAQLKADGAEQAAIDAAAADAQAKADAAEDAAIAAAALDATAKAEQAEADATAAAALDATEKANEAKQDAIDAAAIDATNKAEQALQDAKTDTNNKLLTKTRTYFQAAKPTGGTYLQGDTWIDSDDGNKVYVYDTTGGFNDFRLAQDATIDKALYSTFPTDFDTAATNKWLFTKYSKVTSASHIPQFSDIVGSAGTSSLVNDASSLVANVDNNYIGQLRTIVNVVSATSIPMTATHDDGARIYVDGVSIYNSSVFTSNAKFTLTLSAGWHVIDFLWAEQAGGDGFTAVTPLLSTQVTNMYAPVSLAAVSATATTAVTAANGKNKIIYSTSDASGTSGYAAGDTWFKKDAGTGTILAQWEFTTSWQPRILSESVIGNLSAGKIVADWLEAGQIKVGAIDASKLNVSMGGANLVYNSSFEVDSNSDGLADGWSVWTRGSGDAGRVFSNTRVAGLFPGSTYAQKVTTVDATNTEQSSIQGTQLFSIGAAAKVVLSLYGRASVAGAFSISLRCEDDAGVYKGDAAFTANFTTTAQRFSGMVVTPAGTTKAKVTITTPMAPADGSWFEVDGIKAELGDVLSAWSPLTSELLPGTIVGNLIEANALNGKTITGSTIQTETTANRGIKLTTSELAGWDTSGVKNFSLTSTGSLTIKGALTSGSTVTGATVTGSTVQTEATTSRGIKLTSTELVGYDSIGVKNFSLGTDGSLALKGAITSGSTITGATVTGSTVQTEATASRGIKLTSTELAGYDAAGVKNFALGTDGSLTMKGAITSGSTVTGATVTGSTIQTEATASRGIKLTTAELAGFDASGNKNFSLSTGGTLALKGAIQTGSTITGATLTGAGIETTATAARGVKIASTGITTYDGSGNMTFKVDASTGLVEAPGLKANSITGTMIAADTVSARNIAIGDFTNLYTSPHHLVETGGVTLGGGATLYSGVEVPPVGLAANIGTRDHVGSEKVSIRPGDQFYIEFTAKKINGTAALNAGIWITTITNGAGSGWSQWQGLNGGMAQIADLGNGWARYKSTPYVPDNFTGAAWAQLYLQLSQFSPYDTNWLVADILWRRRGGGELIVDGAIDGKTITGATVQTIATASRGIKLTSAEFAGYDSTGVKNFSLLADGTLSLKGAITSGSTITGATVTGSTVQTEATASRGIKLTSTELAGYDGAGVKNLSLTSAGALTLRGEIKSGSTIEGAKITGTQGIETSTVANTGVKINNAGIKAYDGSNNLTFSVDAATGLIEAPGLKANSITSTMISATAIDGKVITGATVQTETTANRGIKLTNSELAGWDGSGNKNFSLTSAGALTLKGELKSGSSISGASLTAGGGGIYTSASANTGVKITDAGIKAYGGGSLTFHLDATTGMLEVPGLKANSITGDKIAAQTLSAKHLAVGDFTNLATIDELNGVTITSYGQTEIVNGYNKLVTDSGQFLMFTEKRGPVPFKAGEKVHFEFTAKATSATTVNFGLWTYDAVDAVSNVNSANLNVGTTDTPITGEITVNNANLDTAKKFVVGLLNVTNKGIQVKNVRVYRKLGATSIADGSIKTDHMLSGTIDAGILTAGSIKSPMIAAKSLQADRLAVTSTDNLITEADFGNSGSSWDLTPAYKFIIADRGRGGLPALRVVGTTSEVFAKNLSNRFKVDEKNRYRAQITVRSTEALAAGKVKMILRCYTTATAYTDVVAVSSPLLVVNTWTEVQGMAPELPAGTLSVEVLLSVQNGADATWTEIDYVSLTRALDSKLVVDGSITAVALAAESVQAKHLTAQSIRASALDVDELWSNQSWLGEAGASSLKLSTQSTAVSSVVVDSNGASAVYWDQVSSEVNANGIRVYNTKTDANGAFVDEDPIIQLGTFSDDYFQINSGDTSTLINMDSAGTITAKTVEAEEIMYRGSTLERYIDTRPRGMAAWGQVPITSSMAVSSGSEIGLFEIAWDAQDANDATLDDELNLARMYQFNVNEFLINTGGAGIFGLRLRYTTNGTAPTITNSSVLGYNYFRTDQAGLTGTGSFTRIIGSNNGQHLRVLLTMYATGSNANVYTGVGQTHLYSTVMDLGATRPGSAIASTGGGTPYAGAPVVPPPTEPKVTRTVEYGYYGVRSFLPSGAAYNYNTSKAYQGLSPAGYGNLSSQYTFNQNFQTLLSGATVNDIWVYLYFEHWYNNAGGTARIRLHNNLTTPATNVGMTANGINSTAWPKGAGRWVRLPSSLYAGFQSGAYRGFGLTGDGTYNTYGIANNARIRIKYTK